MKQNATRVPQKKSLSGQRAVQAQGGAVSTTHGFRATPLAKTDEDKRRVPTRGCFTSIRGHTPSHAAIGGIDEFAGVGSDHQG